MSPTTRKSNRGEIRMSMVAIASLIMVGLILIFSFSVAGKAFHIFSRDTGSQGAQMVTQLANQMFFLENAKKGDGLDSALSIHEEDLYMFFSAGNAPIFLKRKNGQMSQHLIFKRPNATECDGKACICHCGAGPYWEEITPGKLDFYLRLGVPYTCPEQYLTCQTPPDEMAVFGNSRGYHDDFYDSVLAKTKEYKKQNDIYYPIPMDVVLLGQTTLKDTTITSGYNTNRQSNSLVGDLTKNYQWDGGVVIGGTGVPDRKQKTLDTVQTILRMEKASVFVGTYGVCLHTECITSSGSGTGFLEHRRDMIREINKFLPKIKESQEKLFREAEVDCFSSGTLSSDELDVCNEKFSDMGFTIADGDAVYLRDSAVYLLTFDFISDGVYEVTPQSLVVASCATPELLEVITEEPFMVHIPIGFAGGAKPSDFTIVDSIELTSNSQTTNYVFVTEKSIEEICTTPGIDTPTQSLMRSIAQPYAVSVVPPSAKIPNNVLLFTLGNSALLPNYANPTTP